jgi:N-acetylmuramoyl-L-alanine amidase
MAAIIRSIFRVKFFYLFIVSIYFTFPAEGQKREALSQKTVVIDAGHGGKDPGTVVGIAKEKNVVLDIALKLGKLIRQNQKNIKVVFTRDGDYFIPLMDRPQIANKINASLFISIHANYCKSPEVNGTETYVLGLHRTEDNLDVAKKENSVILLEDDYSTRYEGFNPNLSESYIMFELMQDAYLDQSLRFASILQSNFKEQAQRHDREVRQAGFLVLRETSMPSVLIETGYLSNKKENNFLLTDAGRSEIAQSIYISLVNYLNKIDAKDNIAIQPKDEGIADTGKSQKVKITKAEIKSEVEASNSKNIDYKTKTKSPTLEKPKDIKEPSARKNIPENNVSADKIPEQKVSANTMTYAIQIYLLSKRANIDSKVFKGISPIKEVMANGKYKYFCYESESFEVVKSNFATVKTYFPDAFIVSIKNNQIRMVGDGHGKK